MASPCCRTVNSLTPPAQSNWQSTARRVRQTQEHPERQVQDLELLPTPLTTQQNARSIAQRARRARERAERERLNQPVPVAQSIPTSITSSSPRSTTQRVRQAEECAKRQAQDLELLQTPPTTQQNVRSVAQQVCRACEHAERERLKQPPSPTRTRLHNVQSEGIIPVQVDC